MAGWRWKSDLVTQADVLAIAFTRDAGGRVAGLTMSGPRTREVRFSRRPPAATN